MPSSHFDLASDSNPELVSSHSVTSSLVHSSLPRHRSSVPSLSLSLSFLSTLLVLESLSRPARPQLLLTTRNSSSPRVEYNQPPRLEKTTLDLGSEVRLDRPTQAGFRLSSVLHRKYKSFHPSWFASITRRKDGFGPPRSCRVDNRKRAGRGIVSNLEGRDRDRHPTAIISHNTMGDLSRKMLRENRLVRRTDTGVEMDGPGSKDVMGNAKDGLVLESCSITDAIDLAPYRKSGDGVLGRVSVAECLLNRVGAMMLAIRTDPCHDVTWCWHIARYTFDQSRQR
jgi:hypothetical protein